MAWNPVETPEIGSWKTGTEIMTERAQKIEFDRAMKEKVPMEATEYDPACEENLRKRLERLLNNLDAYEVQARQATRDIQGSKVEPKNGCEKGDAEKASLKDIVVACEVAAERIGFSISRILREVN